MTERIDRRLVSILSMLAVLGSWVILAPDARGDLAISVQGIEITQAAQCFDKSKGFTQCPDNFLELSDHKPALVRIYLTHNLGALCNIFRVTVPVQIEWIVTPPDVTLPTVASRSFVLPCSTDIDVLRKTLNGSANFVLFPEAFAKKPGQVKTLSVDAKVSGHTKSASVKVAPRDLFDVAWIPFFYDPEPLLEPDTCRYDRKRKCNSDSDCAKSNGGPGGSCWKVYAGANSPDLSRASQASPIIKRMYPMRVGYRKFPGFFPWVSGIPNPANYLFLCKKCVDIRDSKGALLTALEKFRLLAKPRPDSLVGWLPNSIATPSSDCSGQATIGASGQGGSAVVIQCPTLLGDQRLGAHEIAHNRGIRHPGSDKCWPYPKQSQSDSGFDDIKEVGADIALVSLFGYQLALGNLIPEKEPDISVSAAYSRWVSPYSWNAMLYETHGPQWSGCSSPPLPGGGSSWGPQKGMAIGGRIKTDGSAELDPIFQFETEGILPPLDPRAEYCIDLEDLAGQILLTHCFDLPLAETANDEQADDGGFVFLLPYQEGAERVVLRRQGVELIRRVASSNPPDRPSVIVDVEVSGEPVTGPLGVSCSGSDPDGDEISFAILYSPDGGASVYPLAIDPANLEGEIDLSRLPGGENAMIRVLASDGFQTSAADSTVFQVTRKGPEVVILGPDDGTRLGSAHDVVLTGHADDLEDGELQGSSLVWVSDRDGELGSGAELYLTSHTLSVNTHEITLIATDSDGMTAEDSVTVTVVLTLDLDIKPGSHPNSVNPFARGSVPVAILGSESFDVTDVDAATLVFGPDGASPRHRLADASVFAEHLEDVNGDGFTDLVSHYRMPETGIAKEDAHACLGGETLGGVTLGGCDEIATAPR